MRPIALPRHADELFTAKGAETAVRVRRVATLVATVHDRTDDWTGLRILDVGCGEGIFALEAGLHGARVVAIDARAERMATGRALAEELRLTNVEFVRADVRSYRFEDHGPFDVILFLGILYHLDARTLFEVTRRAAAATTRTWIVETHRAPGAEDAVTEHGEVYRGWTYREHRPEDAPAVRGGRLLASTANDASFWLTAEASFRLLRRLGFATVLQCHTPAQPFE